MWICPGWAMPGGFGCGSGTERREGFTACRFGADSSKTVAIKFRIEAGGSCLARQHPALVILDLAVVFQSAPCKLRSTALLRRGTIPSPLSHYALSLACSSRGHFHPGST